MSSRLGRTSCGGNDAGIDNGTFADQKSPAFQLMLEFVRQTLGEMRSIRLWRKRQIMVASGTALWSSPGKAHELDKRQAIAQGPRLSGLSGSSRRLPQTIWALPAEVSDSSWLAAWKSR